MKSAALISISGKLKGTMSSLLGRRKFWARMCTRTVHTVIVYARFLYFSGGLMLYFSCDIFDIQYLTIKLNEINVISTVFTFKEIHMKHPTPPIHPTPPPKKKVNGVLVQYNTEYRTTITYMYTVFQIPPFKFTPKQQ